MRHYDVSGPTDVVKLAYGRDYVGSPKYQEDHVNATSDELYAYDALHRLTSFKRGNLNDDKDAITGDPVREQSWTLRHVGNPPPPLLRRGYAGLRRAGWDAVVSKTNGSDDSPYDPPSSRWARTTAGRRPHPRQGQRDRHHRPPGGQAA